MLQSIASAFGLGLAGIDPVGALLLLSAIGAKISRSKIAVFAMAVFLSTLFAGIFLSAVGAEVLDELSRSALFSDTSSVWAYVEILLALLIIDWLVRVHYMRNTPKKAKKPTRILHGSYGAFVVAGFVFALTSVIDPTFIAVVALAAKESSTTTVMMHSVWILVSQVMFFGLAIAYWRGAHEPLVRWARSRWERHQALLKALLYITAVAAALFFVVDAGWYFITGKYLL